MCGREGSGTSWLQTREGIKFLVVRSFVLHWGESVWHVRLTFITNHGNCINQKILDLGEDENLNRVRYFESIDIGGMEERK